MKKYRYIVVVRAPKGQVFEILDPRMNGRTKHSMCLVQRRADGVHFRTREKALAVAAEARANHPGFTYKVFHVQQVRRQK